MELLLILLGSSLLSTLQSLPVKVSRSLDDDNAELIRFLLNPVKPENDSVVGVSGTAKEEKLYSVDQILKINSHLKGDEFENVSILFGDIAVDNRLGNADWCTSSSCRWPKARDGNVYIPYRLSPQFRTDEQQVIRDAMKAIEKETCIRYRQQSVEKDYLLLQPTDGCWSFIGRQGGKQAVSIGQGCVYNGIIQHELLHALGFHHEQSRSDRDDYVNIFLRNIMRGMESNFAKLDTNNLGTHYDYSSIMHYGKYAFSSNGQPTILPKPDPSISIGQRFRLSPTDIKKIIKLYKCMVFEEE